MYRQCTHGRPIQQHGSLAACTSACLCSTPAVSSLSRSRPCKHLSDGRPARTQLHSRNPGHHVGHHSRLCASQTAPVTGPGTKPEWTGVSLLSLLINAAFSVPSLSKWLKNTAKNTIISSALKSGIAWQEHVQHLENTPEVYQLQQHVTNTSVSYPDYYVQPFHAYEEGNLAWLPAFEAEPATDVVAARTFRDQGLSVQEAQDLLRQNFHDAIQEYIHQHRLAEPKDILDVGCGTGISTRYLAQAFPQANRILGLDLSPYFLSVAELRRREAEQQQSSWSRQVSYVHALGEATELPSASFDVVNSTFTVHECTSAAIQDLVTEARRLLRPDGLIAITDNNPESKSIQALKPIAVLMKVTEPWSDEYYSVDITSVLHAAGFGDVQIVAADHRHRVVLGRAI